MDFTETYLQKTIDFVEWCTKNKTDKNGFYKVLLMNLQVQMEMLKAVKDIVGCYLPKITIPHTLLMDIRSVYNEHFSEYVFSNECDL